MSSFMDSRRSTYLCSLVSTEVVTTRFGGVARFNCSAPTGGSVEWKRRLPNQFSYIYVPPWLHKPYDTGGRHNVSWDPQTGACDLVIMNVTEDDAGKYICTETIERREKPIELVVLLDDNPTCHANTSDVLIDNDCDIDPDYIEFNCSIAYRGNVAPDMQLQMSSIGVLDNLTVRTWQQSTTTYMSVITVTRASWQMRDGRFRCEVRNAMVGIQPTCSSASVSVIYFYKSNSTQEITPNRDIQAHPSVTCAANSSERCSFKWRGTYRNSSKPSDLLNWLGPTIDLTSRDVELSSIRCRAECRIRSIVCLSEPIFITFPPGEGDNSKIIIPAIIVFIIAVVILAIVIVILRRSKRRLTKKETDRESLGETDLDMPCLTVPDVQAIGRIAMKEDESKVRGVAWLENKIYVVCVRPNLVRVYPDREPFDELKDETIEIKKMKAPWDMTASGVSRSIFISDQENESIRRIQMTSKKISLWEIHGRPGRLSINSSDELIVVVHRERYHYIDMYRCKDGKRIKSIYVDDGLLRLERMPLPRVAQSSNGNFIIVHESRSDYGACVISEVSIDGRKIIRTFDPKSIDSKEWWPQHLSIDEDDNIFIADSAHDRVVLLSPRLDQHQILLDRDQHQMETPARLCYIREKHMLIVMHGWYSTSVSLFSLSKHRP